MSELYSWSYADSPRVKSDVPQCKDYTEIQGDLIKSALEGNFDVITHGCNCYCTMAHGIAVPMRDVFKANTFKLEGGSYKGDYNKLGQIDFEHMLIDIVLNQPTQQFASEIKSKELSHRFKELYVVNSYTQYGPGIPNTQYGIPLDYDALRLCLRKINKQFKGLHVGMPKIGCGLAKGDWKHVSKIIKEEMLDCKVTVMSL